jgi:phosphatidate cytidylyltransferase
MINWLAAKTSLSSDFLQMISIIYLVLAFFSLLFIPLSYKKKTKGLREITLRIYSWWAILILITLVFMLPNWLATGTMAFLTFSALREYLANVVKETHYRRTLFLVYLTIPVQFYLARYGSPYSFNFFIPVFVFFIMPIRNVLSGSHEKYIEFNGKVFWGVMLIVYGFSLVTFLRYRVMIKDFTGSPELLILLIVFLTQFNDVLQFLWGKSIGKNKLSPVISPNKTIEGFVGAALTMGGVTYLLSSYLPFRSAWETIFFGVALSTLGLFGDLNMSAIKRDLGIKDMDDLIPGHGGILDRLDSLSFTLPFTMHYLIIRGYVL